MKKYLFFGLFLLSVAFMECRKPNYGLENTHTAIDIEQFRQPGMSDFELLQKLVDSLPENATLKFGNKTYNFDHTVIVMKSLNFLGPAIIKREDQITYKLKEAATEHSKYLILDHVQGLRVTDRFLLANGTSHLNTTGINVIIGIAGDTVFINQPLGKYIDQTNEFSSGTNLFKNINFFWILDPNIYPNKKCGFKDITFNGNRAQNMGSYSWRLNTAITALTKGLTTYENCTFINSPGETIVGHNAEIRNCKFSNLNGSAFHTSADRVFNTEEEIHSYLEGNLFENTNQVSTTVNGHSEGAITHSNSGGYYTAVNNKFINVGESVLGALYPSLHEHDWGTSHIKFENNYISTQGRMIYLIDTKTEGEINEVQIKDNDVYQLSPNDWSDALKSFPDIVLENQVNR